MKKLSINEIKSIQIKILDNFSNFCEKNNLKYSLAYGTLLGAIRHKGYIPWDDDIDVVMPRNDYEIFVRTFNYNSRYKVIAPKIARPHKYAYAKVIDINTLLIEKVDYIINNYSVYIDVFPIDSLPDNYLKRKSIFQLAHFVGWLFVVLNSSALVNIRYLSVKRKIMWFLVKILYFVHFDILIYNFIIKILQLIRGYKYFGLVIAGYGEKEIVDFNMFSNLILVEFEGKKYKIIKEYDTLLKSLYGDYMILPPIEKRINSHNYNAYII